MFDLEKAIGQWRQQMLAAGIKTPVPLEELDAHLREEIERQIKIGLNEDAAFKAAALEIGQAYELRREFNKVEHRIAREIGLAFGWLLAGSALWWVVLMLDLDLNFFNFSPELKLMTVIYILGIAVLEAGFCCLIRVRQGRVNRVISVFVCLCLAWTAFSSYLPPEPMTKAIVTETAPGNIMLQGILPAEQVTKAVVHETAESARIAEAFSRHAPSPLWYRSSLTLLLCLPGMFWIASKFRHANRRPPVFEPTQ